jgi:hypothetical protein
VKDRKPESFEVIQPIVFAVTVLGRDHTGHVGNLTVAVDGLRLFTLNSFPLSDLARQAAVWSVAVDDADHYTAFIYRDEQDRWLGAFRIEPRPDGWQFTSVFEDRRHWRVGRRLNGPKKTPADGGIGRIGRIGSGEGVCERRCEVGWGEGRVRSLADFFGAALWLPGARVPGWLGGDGASNGGHRSYLD